MHPEWCLKLEARAGWCNLGEMAVGGISRAVDILTRPDSFELKLLFSRLHGPARRGLSAVIVGGACPPFRASVDGSQPSVLLRCTHHAAVDANGVLGRRFRAQVLFGGAEEQVAPGAGLFQHDWRHIWLRRIRPAECAGAYVAMPSFVEEFLSQSSFFGHECALSSLGVIRTIPGSVETTLPGDAHDGMSMPADVAESPCASRLAGVLISILRDHLPASSLPSATVLPAALSLSKLSSWRALG